MSNRQSNISQTIRKESLMICFREAIQSSDARDRRTDIGKSLRLADMNSIDGLEVLFKVLKERYEPLMPLEKRQISLASQLATTDGQFVCPSCQVDFMTQKSFSGHGPNRCATRKSQKP